ncbi:MAG: GTP-binding protein [Paenibacillaceae bacterium]|jgi:flagellar biosynthesis protein FlhF|nr:GTP-binding protein [Paenibacillaceae bacterium]
MRVKRYVVDSMPDALQQIRSDLGKDAVILNTKEIRSGGFLGLFSKKKIEVIAATDSASNGAAAARSVAAKQFKASSPANSAGVAVLNHPDLSSEEKAASILQSISMLSGKRESVQQDPASAVPNPVVPAARGAALYGSSSGLAVSVPVPAPAAAEKPQAPQKQEPKEAPTEDPVLSELRSMKQLMQKLSQGVQASAPNPVLQQLEDRLAAQEVAPEIIANILNGIEQHSEETGEEITEESAEQQIRDQLRLMLGANTRKQLQQDTRIAHFVGPTGVGKTTTIAKLAAEQVLKHRRKVGFITSDTYRIAAVDQLKTYATILGVPLEVVFSPLDLKKAFENLQDRDIIFMDTAGRNFRNEMYVSELNALLHAGIKSETYLVLSLTMKYKDMRVVADNFSRFKLDKVLFTKRDETETFGSIINLMNEFPLELSYMTTGQNVPEDFAIADENAIIDLILEEKADE